MARTPPQAGSPRSPRRAARPPTRAHALTLLPTALACLSAIGDAEAQRSCEEWSADVTAVEGRVEVRPKDAPRWFALTSGERVCTGAVLRSQSSSRALITLPDGTTLRLDENSTLGIPEPLSGVGTLIELLRGVIHIISRDPRFLQFATPYANAGLEGTEFDIRVDDEARLTEVVVLEGEVVVSTPSGKLNVTDDQVAVAVDGGEPTAAPIARPIERMRWASYYPPVIDGQLPDAGREPDDRERIDPEFFARRAAARLATARIDAAESDIDNALRLDESNATALSLRALIALARADRRAARETVAQALATDPQSVAAKLVASHVEQSSLQLAAAERQLREALELEPANGLVLTRLAEIALAQDDAGTAIAMAERARAASPARSAPLVVLGFAHLRALDASAAAAAFEAAVELEPQAPLPRLGLALALIRGDDLVAGRRELELAVSLDPANTLTRSYVAKVYDTEHRGELTATQLALAKRFDPVDPTPWLYSSLQKLRANRPVEAMHDLRAARNKNAEQPVSRSRLALDEDLGTRSAGLGRIYDELGFARLALLDAWDAVADDPTDFAAHRLLADGYASEPLHEIARVSELLVAQLLQPANVVPLKPQLGQRNPFIAHRFGPSQAAFDELASPLAMNGLKLRASAVAGNAGIAGDDFTLAGLNDRVSYSVGHYGFETDGFGDNNDLDQSTVSAFVQYRPTQTTNLQAELRANRVDHGDLALYFNPERRTNLLRASEDTDSVRLGAKHQLAPKHVLLGSIVLQDVTAAVGVDNEQPLRVVQDAYSADVQSIARLRGATVQSGIAASAQDELSTRPITIPGLGTVVATDDESNRQLGAYGYVTFDVTPALAITAGASLYSIEIDSRKEDAANPKLGVVWRPTTKTTLRAAAFKSLFNDLTTSRFNAQPRLEPVQVAGFTQLMLGARGDEATVRGLAVDHELTPNLFAGWQADTRSTDSRGTRVRDGMLEAVDIALRNRSQQLYLYWTPVDRLGVSARYEHSRASSEPVELLSYSHIETDRMPLEVRYFSPTGLTVGTRATRVQQRGSFQTLAGNLEPGEDRFWVMDAFVGYRLPNRRGLLSLNADNLLDERFRFQDIDPTNPSLFPERLVSLRFTLAFD